MKANLEVLECLTAKDGTTSLRKFKSVSNLGVVVTSLRKLMLIFNPGVITRTCNPATLEADFSKVQIQHQLGVIVLQETSGLVLPPVIKHKGRSLTKYWELIKT